VLEVCVLKVRSCQQRIQGIPIVMVEAGTGAVGQQLTLERLPHLPSNIWLRGFGSRVQELGLGFRVFVLLCCKDGVEEGGARECRATLSQVTALMCHIMSDTSSCAVLRVRA